MNNAITRGAVLGVACAMLALGSASAQTYPPGTNCQSLLGGLRTACVNQARSMNSANGTIPNSAGSNTVAPGTNGINNGMNSGTTATPNSMTPNGSVSPNAVVPNGTVSPNAVVPNGTVSPNAVGTPNTAAPTSNQMIVPPAGSGPNGVGNGAGGVGNGTGAGAATGAGAGTGGTTGN
jgi:hypothetical protein